MDRTKLLKTVVAGVVVLSFVAVSEAGYPKKQAAAPAVEPAAAAPADAAAAPQAGAEQAMDPKMTEMMAKMQEYATPNENHKILEALAGNWDYTLSWQMSAESAPEVSNGTSMSQWILGGRYLEQTVSGTSKGQPFEGRGLTGYDNAKKEYFSLWYDNMSTGLMMAKGSYDAATKTLSESGEFECPIKGHMVYRGVLKIVDDNTHAYEMYTMGEDGKEFKNMEITYSRKI